MIKTTLHPWIAKLGPLYVVALGSVSSVACDDDESDAMHDAEHSHAADSGAEDSDASTDDSDAAADSEATLSFFVTSDKSMTGDLGGLAGADARCQKLARGVDAGDKTWHAYLSVSEGENDKPVHARERIGRGPWYNAKGVKLADDIDALHARTGDAEVFLDEHGERINGQWPGSPTPNEHDVLTGSKADGTLLEGKTCADWTSSEAGMSAQVGHSDGLGPNQNPAAPYSSWNSAHESAGCDDTAPRGGAGRLYCFATD